MAVREMVKTGHLKSINAIIAFADRRAEDEIGRLLRKISEADQDQPLNLVVDELFLEISKAKFKAMESRQRELVNLMVGIFLPLAGSLADTNSDTRGLRIFF